jgi:hypothetical protein
LKLMAMRRHGMDAKIGTGDALEQENGAQTAAQLMLHFLPHRL